MIAKDHVPKERAHTHQFFRLCARNYGRTALCLSGGATFSFFHLGVVRELLDHDLLPRVITGTSGGSLIAALIAVRTDEELKEALVPEIGLRLQVTDEPRRVDVWLCFPY